MAKAKKTEAEMLLLLRKKLTYDSGNGPAYAFVEKVRNAAGFDASRTIDAMSMSLWPSRGLRLAAYEIKCSRSDTLKELRTPAKAEVFTPYVDYFWLVVSDADFVGPGELPETWGLMAPHGPGLRVVVEAPLNENPDPPDRSFLAALLRQAGVMASSKPEIEAAKKVGFEEGREAAKRDLGWKRAEKANELKRALEREEKIKEALGGDLARLYDYQTDRLATAIKTALDADRDMDHLRGRLGRLASDAKILGEQADRILAEHFEEAQQ